MILTVVAIYDLAADAYMRPWFAQTPALAMRAFMDEAKRAAEDNPLYKHPDDHALYELGTWDDSTGKFTQLEVPHRLMSGSQFK